MRCALEHSANYERAIERYGDTLGKIVRVDATQNRKTIAAAIRRETSKIIDLTREDGQPQLFPNS